MKTLTLSILLAAMALALPSEVHSQAPQPARTPLQQLQAIKAKNEKLLQTQAATLQKLEEMQLQAHQLKFFGKRT
ncbi:MAG: hypothetical protein QOE70_6756 [Chthoniobacter sp.]|jgi:hypothetical protein|nr:hypothetical protein [Chthoniobacter sp.]